MFDTRPTTQRTPTKRCWICGKPLIRGTFEHKVGSHAGCSETYARAALEDMLGAPAGE